jgi:ABC-type lipoprotein export system ATPase subunit
MSDVASLWREPEPTAGEGAPPALEFRDVFKIYRAGPVETVALRGLSFRAERGEVIAVHGPSGCGKSTMLTLAAALDEPSAGEVRAGANSLQRLDEAELAAYRSRELALVFQSENLWPSLTARENVAGAVSLAGHSDAGRAADAALAHFGLADRGAHRAGALSGGEQQRVAIAAAYARGAALVLADEPTGELDSRNEAIVFDALAQLAADVGSTVIVVTHSTRVAAVAGRVLEMRDGRLWP